MWDMVLLSWIENEPPTRRKGLLPVQTKGRSAELPVTLCLPLTIGVHLVDHVLQLGLCRVLAQRPHDGAELFGGDCAVTVLVE